MNIFRSIGSTQANEVVTTEHNGFPHYIHHDRVSLDQKAKLMVELVKSWSYVELYGDAMRDMANKMHDQPHKMRAAPERQSIEQLVFTAADAADAIYAEAERRGWTIALPPYGQDTEVK